jgi:hypothetical protein
MDRQGPRDNLHDQSVRAAIKYRATVRRRRARQAMKRTIWISLATATALLGACGKGSGSGGKAATIDLFGKKPVPPGDLAKIKAGMTQEDVKKLFPAAKAPSDFSGSPVLEVPSPASDVRYIVGFYDDKKTVADITVRAPKNLGGQLEKAWGPGKKGPMGPEWLDEDDGYEVEVWEMGRNSEIKFKPFTPVNAAYFGSKPAPFDVLAKVKPGMTRDEIAKAAPGFETAGADKGNGSFTPYDGQAGTFQDHVRINIDYDQDNKARDYVVELPAGSGEKLVKAWGAHPGKARGTNSPMNCWDLADGTRIELDGSRVTYTTKENSVCDVAP